MKWLARHQSADGRWASRGFSHLCARKACGDDGDPGHDLEATSAAVLAFLGAGYSPANRASYVDPVTGKTMRFGETVRRALKWLVAEEDEARFALASSPDGARAHALATLALCEAYGLTNALAYRSPAQRAVSRALDARWVDPWGEPRSCEEARAATFAVLAVESAERADLDVDPDPLRLARMRRAIADCALSRPLPRIIDARPIAPAEGLLALSRGRTEESFEPSVAHEAREALLAEARRIEEDARQVTREPTGLFLASAAIFELDGPTGPFWKKWGAIVGKALIGQQHAPGPSRARVPAQRACSDGSWEGTSSATDRARGRAYATAMNVLTLEVYYRYAGVIGVRHDAR